jgi:hypothetical protein
LNTKKLAKALAKRAAFGRRLSEPRNMDWLYSSGRSALRARQKRPKGLKAWLAHMVRGLLGRLLRR